MQFFEVKIKWYCGDPDEDFIEGNSCQGCGEEFETIEVKKDWDDGSLDVSCPKCGISLDANQGILIEGVEPRKPNKKKIKRKRKRRIIVLDF